MTLSAQRFSKEIQSCFFLVKPCEAWPLAPSSACSAWEDCHHRPRRRPSFTVMISKVVIPPDGRPALSRPTLAACSAALSKLLCLRSPLTSPLSKEKGKRGTNLTPPRLRLSPLLLKERGNFVFHLHRPREAGSPPTAFHVSFTPAPDTLHNRRRGPQGRP